MGARGIGHLTELCAIAPPHVALVLNVGKAHLGEFGSQANIAQAKGEIVEALARRGVAVLNADDPLVTGMARGHRRRRGRGPSGPATTPTCGWATSSSTTSAGPPSTWTTRGATERVDLRLLGAHQATNAAAAAAVAVAVGSGWRKVAASLRGIDGSRAGGWSCTERADGLVVVNDAYNANPDSMAVGGGDARRDRRALGPSYGRGAGGDARARARRRTPSTAAVGGSRRGSASTWSWSSATAPRASPTALVEQRGHAGATTTSGAWPRPAAWLREMWRSGRGAGEGIAVRTARAGRPTLLEDRADRRRARRGARRESDPARRRPVAGASPCVGTRYAISVLARHGYGQLIRDDGPTTHHTKRGTPTMGGLVIVLATVLSYFVATFVTGHTPSASALLLMFLFVGLGTVGFLDDYIKIPRQRSLGLRSRAKFIGQTFVALAFGGLALAPWFEDYRGQTPGRARDLVDPRPQGLHPPGDRGGRCSSGC